MLKFIKKYPLFFSITFTATKNSIADAFTQIVIEKKEQFNYPRNLTFCIFGGIFLGGIQHFVLVDNMVKLIPKAKIFAELPFKQKIKNLPIGLELGIKQTLIDCLIWTPFAYYPAFYIIKSYVMDKKINHALCQYKMNFKEDMINYICMWGPVGIINYTFIPLYMRMPTIGIISFIWTVMLSKNRGE